MDRQIIYPGQIPLETDLLNTNKNTMVALSKMASALFGTSAQANGLSVVPTSPASLQVLVNPGEIYSSQNIDATAYSSLAADTTHTIIKQGISLDQVTLSCPAPGTGGQSINYLIEATYQDTDGTPVVLPYYNASNPSTAYSGPANAGTTNNTVRKGTITLVAKAGTAATTGTQTTPAADAGYTGLYVVTVANGQTQINAGSITVLASAPIVPSTGVIAAIQNGLTAYAVDTGTANTYVATYAPTTPTLTDGVRLRFRATNANTGASTFNANGIGATTIFSKRHGALTGGEIIANSDVEVVYNSALSAWVLLESTGGASQLPTNSYGTTAAQFDNSTKLATTAFVKTAGQQFNASGGSNFAVNTTLTASQLGGWGSFGAGSVTVTLPTLASATTGACFTILGSSFAGTLKGNGAETINSNINASSNTLAIGVGESVTVAANGAAWYVVADGFGLANFLNTANVFTQIQSATTPAQLDNSTKLQTTAGANLVGSVVGSTRNLSMSITTASATATITADEISVATALGGAPIRLANFNKTLNLATTGAGGMDTGAAPAGGYLSIYAIYNPGTVTAALLACTYSTSSGPVYTGGNMPSGYTASALVSTWGMNGSSLLSIGQQKDRLITLAANTVLSTTTTQASATSLSLANAAPLNTKTVNGNLSMTFGGSTTTVTLNIGSDVNLTGIQTHRESGTSSTSSENFANLILGSAQTLYYTFANTAGTSTAAITITSYTI